MGITDCGQDFQDLQELETERRRQALAIEREAEITILALSTLKEV